MKKAADRQTNREFIVSLPSITIWGFSRLFINNRFYEKLFNKTIVRPVEENELKIIGETLDGMTFIERMDAMYSAEEISTFIECQELSTIEGMANNSNVNCSQISEIRISMNSVLYCFTLFQQLNGESNDKFIIDFDSNTRSNFYPLMKLHLNFDWNPLIYLALHSRNEPLYDQLKCSFEFIAIPPHCSTLIYFQKTTVQLLPVPYKTACIDYRTLGYNSKEHCIVKCKSDNYLDIYGYLPSELLIYDLDINLTANVVIDWKIDSIVSKKCSKFCGHYNDCYKEYITMSHKNGGSEASPGHVLKFMPSIIPNTKFIQSPKVEVEEFVCFITSIIGLWFGLSVLTISDIIFELSNKMIQLIKCSLSIVNVRIFNIRRIKFQHSNNY